MTPASKKRLKELVGRVAAAAGLYTRDFRSKVVVIAFHRVNDELVGDDLTCSVRKFEIFCEFFRSHFTVVPLSEQVAGCSTARGPGGTLSITFDDGYRDNFEVAAPILRRMGLPASFFVTSGFVGTSTVAPWDRELQVQPGWMTWDQVRGLAAQGFEIGSHTETHLDLGTADAQAVLADLDRSRSHMRLELGSEPRLFAYPFGGRQNICERSLELVRAAGFLCCVSCCGGVNAPATDPYAINRIPIGNWFAAPHQFGYELLRTPVEAVPSGRAS